MRCMKALWSTITLALVCGALAGLTGCKTKSVDWNSRVGVYTQDDAIRELGPPEKSAKLTDGSTVSDWLTGRGMRTAMTYSGGWWYPYGPYAFTRPSHGIVAPPAPDRFFRPVFDPEGKLASWQRVYR